MTTRLFRSMTAPIVPAALLLAVLASDGIAQGGPPPPPPPLPPVNAPPQNAITEAKRVLGKILFWEEQLSSDNTVSCGTCHKPNFGGTDSRLAINPGLDGLVNTPDDVRGSPGVARTNAAGDFVRDPLFAFNAQITPRRAPDFEMGAYSPLLFWDGRAGPSFTDPVSNTVVIPVGGALEAQSLGPILANNEMAHTGRTFADAVTKLQSVSPLKLATNIPPDMANAIAAAGSYPALFQTAFGSPVISAQRIAFAIATYERTLVPNQTPYDAWAAGNPNALTQVELQGFNAFNNVGRCNVCHTAPTFSDNTFRNLGLRPIAEDSGRQAITNNVNDRGKFKVPSLRNAALRSRFMHTGGIPTLAGVVGFYAGGGGPNLDNKDPVLAGLAFPPLVAQQLGAFLQALVDPRAAAGTFPFDRPTLRSEVVPPNSNRFGPSTPGSGNVPPQMLATSPLAINVPDWKIGLGRALGGTQAFLVLATNDSVPATNINGLLVNLDINQLVTSIPVPTSGAGPDNGAATVHLAIGNAPALVGADAYFQWVILDPAGAGGVSASQGARFQIF